MLRSVVFTCLLDVMRDEFSPLEQAPRDLAGLVITDVCVMLESEGWTDVYAAAQEFARRVTPEDREPGYLTRYAEGLLAQEARRRIIPGTLVYQVSYGVRGEPGPMRNARVVIGGVDEPNATTLDDIPRILSVAHLWGTEGASRIYIISLSLDFTRSDLSDRD